MTPTSKPVPMLEPLEFLRAKIIIWSVALVVKSMSPVKILIPPEVLSNEKDGLREAKEKFKEVSPSDAVAVSTSMEKVAPDAIVPTSRKVPEQEIVLTSSPKKLGRVNCTSCFPEINGVVAEDVIIAPSSVRGKISRVLLPQLMVGVATLK